MIQAPVTALYAGLSAVLIVVLGMLVVRQRIRTRTPLGTGRAPALECAVRAHANTIEYVPIALLLMLIAELNRGAASMLHSYGIALIAARILHAWGISRTPKPNPGRLIGTALTWMVITGLAAVDIITFAKT